ncbi:hypothetical protein HaLaN_16573 [Haematococcus lacustris]|uniref:Uncharacterized protein n=1 Tax=Haematococcus lacustris TaxID=44745 RepID=A0A699ZCV6_HAELA|nr:hypothetical protein HaLaN_16573 [Haematococcus lacustris]
MSPAGSGTGVFHVVIEGVDVSYDITDDGPTGSIADYVAKLATNLARQPLATCSNAHVCAAGVLIGGASLTSPLAQQHALKHRG